MIFNFGLGLVPGDVVIVRSFDCIIYFIVALEPEHRRVTLIKIKNSRTKIIVRNADFFSSLEIARVLHVDVGGGGARCSTWDSRR